MLWLQSREYQTIVVRLYLINDIMEKEGALINSISSNILWYKHKIIYNNELRTEQRLTQTWCHWNEGDDRLYSNEVATTSTLKLTGYADGSP